VSSPIKANGEEAFLQTILSSIADGVFSVDGDWRITSFNPAAERITGVPAEQAIGMRCSDVFHADLCERGCALRESVETGKNLVGVRARILDSRGRRLPISLSTAVLRDSEGRFLGAVETFRDLSAIEELRREIKRQYTFEDIVGKSRAFKKIFSLLPDVAESDATVLIEGPSGSGKELLARAVHNLSPRRSQPYVVVNCGALPVNLFESELFGYAQGAFTDAKRDKPGRLKLAEGGTIVFDEVSELPPATQVKLLRVLQEREYEPLGSVETVRANVRVVAVTNKKLVELVSERRFRDDLYFRLSVARLTIPCLRERREDIPYLVERFIQRFNAKRGKQIDGVTPAVMEVLMRHDFPGNVRELENIIEYAFVLCHSDTIDICHLPEELQPRGKPSVAVDQSSPRFKLEQAEADVVRAALAHTYGSINKAAEELGISRTTLWRKMKRFGVAADEYRKQ
jgi:PAS domain S-box-containing protein